MEQAQKDARFNVLRDGLERVCLAYNTAFGDRNGHEIMKRQIPSWLIRIQQIEEDMNANCYNPQISDDQWRQEVNNWVAAWQKTFDKAK